MAALTNSSALQARKGSAISGVIPLHGPALLGTGFETLHPLAISTNLLKFLKSLGLDSVGLGLDCIPFHSRWELTVWRPNLHAIETNYLEILEICDEVEDEEHLEVLGLKLS